MQREIRVRYYEVDDSVLVDGEYVIRGVAGRILWLLLSMREAEGRSTFLNRELRVHPFLKLPAFRDNLENRLLSLERRMEKLALPIRLDRAERGRMRLACEACPRLEKIAA